MICKYRTRILCSTVQKIVPMKKLILLILIVNFSVSNSLSAAGIPDRIISLAPNVTEILFAIGAGDRIVGVTSFCDYPPGAKRKPKVGGMSNPSLETVVALEPDIVILTPDGNQKEFDERLRSLKIKTYVFRVRRLSELPQGIKDLGVAVGSKDKAEKLAEETERATNNFKTRRQGPNPLSPAPGRVGMGGVAVKQKVLFIIWPEPLIVAGPGTAIDDAITLLGCENVASGAKVRYPKYSIEAIIRQAPDLIFIGKGHANMKEVSESLLKRMAGVPAVRKGAVFFVSDNLYRLGPRVVRGIEEMDECLK